MKMIIIKNGTGDNIKLNRTALGNLCLTLTDDQNKTVAVMLLNECETDELIGSLIHMHNDIFDHSDDITLFDDDLDLDEVDHESP